MRRLRFSSAIRCALVMLCECAWVEGRLNLPLHLRGGQWHDGGVGSGPQKPWEQPPPPQWQQPPQAAQPPPQPYGGAQQAYRVGQDEPPNWPQHGAQGQLGGPQPSPQGHPMQQQTQQQMMPQQSGPYAMPGYGAQPYQMAAMGGPGGGPSPFMPVFHDLVRVPARYGPGGQQALDPATLPQPDRKQALALRQPKRVDALALSFHAVADSAELQESLRLPFGCLVQPLASDAVVIKKPKAEEESAAAAAAAKGGWRAPPTPQLVCRCQSCNGYLNPFATMWPQAAKWECNLCGSINDLPPPALPPHMEHQQDGQGRGLLGSLWSGRGSPSQPTAGATGDMPPPLGRPETVHADVEYVLSGEEAQSYCTAADGRPRVLVVALETTSAAADSGALHTACCVCKEALAEAAAASDSGATPLRVALVTFDEVARVYRLNEPSTGAPAVELMLPTKQGLPSLPRTASLPLYDVKERLNDLCELLDKIAQVATAGTTGGAAMGAAVEIARSLAAGCSGDLVLLSVTGATSGPASTHRELPTPKGPVQQDIRQAGRFFPGDRKEHKEKDTADVAAALERLVRAENTAMHELGKACAEAQLAVRLIVAPIAKQPVAEPRAPAGYPRWGAPPPSPLPFVDVASLAQLPRLSGGRLFYVPPNTVGQMAGNPSHRDVAATEDLAAATREAMRVTHAATDTVLRLRTSRGLKAIGLRSLSGISSHPDDEPILLLPSLDKHASFAAELRHIDDKKPLSPQGAYVQSALLFTAPTGERRVRVSTRRVAVVDNLRGLAQAIVPPVALVLRAKLALAEAEKKPISAVRDELKVEIVEGLVAQRELCPPPLRKTADEIILFRTLALMPLFFLALSSYPVLNTPMMNPTAMQSPDALAALAHEMRLLPTDLACLSLLPRLFIVHERSLGDSWAPPLESSNAAPAPSLPSSSDGETPPKHDGSSVDSSVAGATDTVSRLAQSEATKETRETLLPCPLDISPASIVLLDSLHELTLWVGSQASPSFLELLFGNTQPQDGAPLLRKGSNLAVDRLHSLVASLRSQRPMHAPLRIVCQGSPVGDAQLFGRLYASAYQPFLLQLLSEQRSRL